VVLSKTLRFWAPADNYQSEWGVDNVNGLLRKSWLRRAMAVGVSAALVGGVSLVGASSASGVPVDTYSVSGVVSTPDSPSPVALDGVSTTLSMVFGKYLSPVASQKTASGGAFLFENLASGDYRVSVSFATYGDTFVNFTIANANVEDKNVTMLPNLSVGTVSLTGTPVVGNTLTAVTAGWPVGSSLTYEWQYSFGQGGGVIEDATARTFTVTDSVVAFWIGVRVTGSQTGFASVFVDSALQDQASAPEKAAAPAPTNLADYLANNGSTPADQTSTGLPEGSLNPATAYTADVDWTSGDSFVDVYVFSTPTLVGTFPVVNGIAQITLSPGLLSQLAAGNHTLVVTGQSSGAVQSVALNVGAALAKTGFDTAGFVTVSSFLALLGGALVLVRRRIRVRS
jgi:hypothetical protein